MWYYLLIILPVAVVLWLLYEWMEHFMVEYNTNICWYIFEHLLIFQTRFQAEILGLQDLRDLTSSGQHSLCLELLLDMC